MPPRRGPFFAPKNPRRACVPPSRGGIKPPQSPKSRGELDAQHRMKVRFPKFPKWLIVVWMLCIPAGIIVSLLVHFQMDMIPEKPLAIAAARTNANVQAVFGENVQISSQEDSQDEIEFHTGGLRKGETYCDVQGPKGQGIIVVRWTSKGNRQEFRVLSIERCVKGTRNEMIWQPSEKSAAH